MHEEQPTFKYEEMENTMAIELRGDTNNNNYIGTLQVVNILS